MDTEESGCEDDGSSGDDEDSRERTGNNKISSRSRTHQEDRLNKPPHGATANHVDKAIAGGVGKVTTLSSPTGGMDCPPIDSLAASNNGVQASALLLRGSGEIHQKTVFGQIQGVLNGMTGCFTGFLLPNRACGSETGVLGSSSMGAP